MKIYKINRNSLNTFLKKSVSLVLALLFFISPFGNVSFAFNVGTTGSDGVISDLVIGSSNNLQTGSVGESTGDYNYLYEIKVPKARGENTPNVNLSYSSQRASDLDSFGYGWDVSIPSIQRINKTGVDNLYSTSTPYFISRLSGEIVKVDSGNTYRAKVETGDFFEYTYINYYTEN
jgi:hypothetical protein